MDSSLEIVHEPASQRYVANVGGFLSVCEYEWVDGRMVFTHTYTPPEVRGRGIAERLVRAALADARAQGKKIVPACSYVDAFVKRHPEFQDLVE